jgi:hypothetical protein
MAEPRPMAVIVKLDGVEVGRIPIGQNETLVTIMLQYPPGSRQGIPGYFEGSTKVEMNRPQEDELVFRFRRPPGRG